METLILRDFSDFAEETPVIPEKVKDYFNSNNGVVGKHFRLEKLEKSENTGDGMSYYDRLRISTNEGVVYDTGYRLWRPGYAFSTDRYDRCINNVQLMSETEDILIFGYRDGEGLIFIYSCNRKGQINEVCKFDLEAYNKIIKNQEEPKDSKSFEYWVGRNLPEIGGASWHCDIKYNDEKECVVVARHCSRSVDASHDAFMIFVWKKGKGVGKSKLHYTGARDTYRKFSSNYLIVSINKADDGAFFFDAKSFLRDVEIKMKFIF